MVDMNTCWSNMNSLVTLTFFTFHAGLSSSEDEEEFSCFLRLFFLSEDDVATKATGGSLELVSVHSGSVRRLGWPQKFSTKF